MGSPKALLLDNRGRPFITRVVEVMAAGGAAPVVVVTGRDHDAVAAALRQQAGGPVVLARNPEPDRGQLSSLWTGLDACPPEADAVAVTLVDIPLLARTTVTAVIGAWSNSGAPIVRPEYRGRRGHPVIFDRRLFEELRRAPLESGARVVVSAHYPEIVNVAVDDPGCVVDVDTRDDYDAVIRTQP